MPLDQIDVDRAENQMSFLEHLEALRRHIFRIIIAIVVGGIVAFSLGDILFDQIIFGPKKLDFWTYRQLCKLSHFIYNNDRLCIKSLGFTTINVKMAGQFIQHITVSLIAGLIIAFPYVLFELWRFLEPGLNAKEKKSAKGIVGWGSLLFFIGVLFGYFFIAPLSINFLGNYTISNQIDNKISIDSYISFVALLTLAAGILFQLPMVMYILAKIGIITTNFLRKYRKHSIVVIFILSAFITPPDVISQIVMAIPIIGLYEISIILVKRIEKTQEEK